MIAPRDSRVAASDTPVLLRLVPDSWCVPMRFLSFPGRTPREARCTLGALAVGALALGACADGPGATAPSPAAAIVAPCAANRANQSQLQLVCSAGVTDAVQTGHAPGGSIFRTGFEPPTYTAGPLTGQDGWLSITHDAAATVSADRPREGRQSMHIDGRLVVPIPGQDATGSVNFRNLFYDTGAAGTPIVDVQADVRLDGPRTYSDDPNDDAVSARLVAIGLDPDGARRRLGFAVVSSVGAFHAEADGGRIVAAAPTTLGHAHTVRMRCDFARRTIEFFLDGRSLGTWPFFDAAATSTVLANVRLDLRAESTPQYDAAPYQASFDKLAVRVARPGAERPDPDDDDGR